MTAEIPLDEVVTFDEVTCASSGAAADADSTPTFSVFEDVTDTPILADQSFVKRTSLTGNYRGTFTASTANGFEVGKWYNVVASATVGGIAGKKKSVTFRLMAVELAAGVPKVDLAYSLGTAVVNSDFAIASATSSTVTLATTYTDGSALPDDSRYVGAVLLVVAGTGQGQLVILTTVTGTARQYNVFAGSMPVQLDSTSRCVLNQTSRARADLANVIVATNLDKTSYTLEAVAQAALIAAIQLGLATPTNITAASGVVLAATGLDAITATTPTGVATTFPQKMMALWARFFGRVVRDPTTIKTYRSNGTTVATTQTYTSSGADEDIGAAI